MIRFLILLAVYCLFSAWADFSIIESNKYVLVEDRQIWLTWWHGLQVARDTVLLLGIAWMVSVPNLYIRHWTDIIMWLVVAIFFRDITRTFITGCGTTAVTDQILGCGFLRLGFWGLLSFFSFVFIHFYYKRERSSRRR